MKSILLKDDERKSFSFSSIHRHTTFTRESYSWQVFSNLRFWLYDCERIVVFRLFLNKIIEKLKFLVGYGTFRNFKKAIVDTNNTLFLFRRKYPFLLDNKTESRNSKIFLNLLTTLKLGLKIIIKVL